MGGSWGAKGLLGGNWGGLTGDWGQLEGGERELGDIEGA